MERKVSFYKPVLLYVLFIIIILQNSNIHEKSFYSCKLFDYDKVTLLRGMCKTETEINMLIDKTSNYRQNCDSRERKEGESRHIKTNNKLSVTAMKIHFYFAECTFALGLK
jgi:hypothetical protein